MTTNVPIVLFPGNDIAIVTLHTPNMKKVAELSEMNIVAYCQRHRYTCYVYRNSIIHKNEAPTWNKPVVLLNHIDSHKYIMWLDADAIFTNFDIKLDDIIKPKYDLLVCGDIGGWRLNAGAQIWKNSAWSRDVLKRLWRSKHLEHMDGGDQAQLIAVLECDGQQEHHHICDQTVFNCHPDKHTNGVFVLHMMGMPDDERIVTFTQWNTQLGIL